MSGFALLATDAMAKRERERRNSLVEDSTEQGLGFKGFRGKEKPGSADF